VAGGIEIVPLFEHATAIDRGYEQSLLRARWREEPLSSTSGVAAATISCHPEELPMSSRRINPETDATYDLDSSAMNRVMSHVL
jgi:hypothetical protein